MKNHNTNRNRCPNCNSCEYFESLNRETCDSCGYDVDYWGAGANKIAEEYQNKVYKEQAHE